MLVLVGLFVGIALAKPWGGAVTPIAPTPEPAATGGLTASSTPADTGGAVPTPAVTPYGSPSADPFGTLVPPPVTAAWTAIDWRQLPPGDPRGLVRSVLRWQGGFLALGSRASSTPIGISKDGLRWERLSANTATFWPGLVTVAMAEVSSGLVALTLLTGTWDCSAAAACPTYSPALPLMAWTSPDGQAWTPNTGPELGMPTTWNEPPLLAAGPDGLVAASPTSPSRVAVSADGVHWRTVPAAALPPGLAIRDIVRTATGFTAVGALKVDADHVRAVSVTSVNGAAWSGPYPLDMATASAFILASTGPSWEATRLVAAPAGLIAEGRVLATPGATLWWQSADGRDWRPLPGYPPLGPTTCTGEGCGSEPDGALVGDDQRMIALRGGAEAGAWASADGLAWQKLAVSGDLPGPTATQARLLPGGVLVSDGSTSWLGQARAN
jgi:hypothetical protein